ncbi:hypothetical protein [Achromobacter phage tuull]|nr:hypothetical protein [Achromobacter phage tuull]
MPRTPTRKKTVSGSTTTSSVCCSRAPVARTAPI